VFQFPINRGIHFHSDNSPELAAIKAKRFNPLSIGAFISTGESQWLMELAEAVSIPYQSGHSFPRENYEHSESHPTCFNPLSIGAFISTGWKFGNGIQRPFCFNPLSIGAFISTLRTTRIRLPEYDMFQSPINRGIHFHLGNMEMWNLWRNFVSIPYQSGHSFPLFHST